MARPVSIMRFEKPHSLSYQLTTRTRPSEVTAVCGAAKDGRTCVMVEVDGDQRCFFIAENTRKRAFGGFFDGQR